MARRLLSIACCLTLAAALAGCGNRHDEPRLFAETEGLYITVDDLEYQIQLSRQLNPDDTEDREYLRGLPDSTLPPGEDEAWFAVFLRVENQTEETKTPAEDFEIVDTEGDSYEPVAIDNAYVYDAQPIRPGELYPKTGSTASQGGVRGAMLLFKLPYDAFQNRPLEFKVQPSAGEEGVIDIDV